jgi:hypothetical protein
VDSGYGGYAASTIIVDVCVCKLRYVRKERIKPHKQWWNKCPGVNIWVISPSTYMYEI